MKTLVILGAGTAGTMVANRLSGMLDEDSWNIVVIDKDETHYYQPGFLYLPFGMYDPTEIVQPKRRFIPQGVSFIHGDVERIEPLENRISLASGLSIDYDELVIATGTSIHPEETLGLRDGGGWHNNIFDFYTYFGAAALGDYLARFERGRIVVNIAELPIKCPVAPLEFLFLADTFFRDRGLRNHIELILATPLSGAFTKPRASAILDEALTRKGIHVEPDFSLAEVDNTRQVIKSYDDREIPYDLLVSIPIHMGASFIGTSQLGDELNFVPTNKHTLQSKKFDNIWVIGDAADVPTSKAGSVAHFELDTLVENVRRHIAGEIPLPTFDGHANCFIESGAGKSYLIDFNYDTEPLPGHYPLPGIGPFTLLGETELNHRAKMAFKWIYWNVLLKGYPIPVPNHMSMLGKQAHTVPHPN